MWNSELGDKRMKKLWKVLRAVLVIGVRMYLLTVTVALCLLAFVFFRPAPPPMSEDEARRGFTNVTGIAWQSNFTMVGHKSEHAGGFGDGEYGVVVTVPVETLNRILASPPPWGTKWRNGPVDYEVGSHCSFIYAERPGGRVVGTEQFDYVGGSEEVRTILGSANTKWCAKQRGSTSMPWHNGNLLIADPSSNRLWLSVWDF